MSSSAAAARRPRACSPPHRPGMCPRFLPTRRCRSPRSWSSCRGSSTSSWASGRQVELVPYSEFEHELAQGRVAEVVVSDRSITGRLKSPEGAKTAIAAARVEPEIAARLDKYGVPYRRVVETGFMRDLMSWVMPVMVFFALWYFVFRRFAEKQGLGGLMSIGRSSAKVYVESNTGVG